MKTTRTLWARLLACALLGMALWLPQAQAQSVAFTFDDGPDLGPTPLLSPQQRNQAMLDALARHRVQAALFVTAARGAVTPEGLALARQWGQAGHLIGNHTMTHPDLHQVPLEQYQRELLDCDAIIRTLPGYRKWFRFTYLREGNTPEKRDGMRAFLRQHGYRNAYVSLDTSDWRLNAKLVEVLERDPKADVGAIKTAYLGHVRQRALAYRDLSRALQGRDIAQVILLHHNLASALWLGDVIAMFRDMGWNIVTPQAAFDDTVYQLAPERSVAGQSLLLSLGRLLGLGKYPGGERLVDDGDFEIAALEAQGL
ncbi:polysaccharide deacetylase family protein [Oxalobacteraceae bacterium A2-2]